MEVNGGFWFKKLPSDIIDKHKSRVVAKGYNQIASVDFNEAFSPVIKHTTIRVVLILTFSRGWILRKSDVNNVFLKEDLEDDVYMTQPLSFEQGKGLVCKLTKALYGLMQAPKV